MFSKKIPKYSTLNMETLSTCDHVNEGWKIHESCGLPSPYALAGWPLALRKTHAEYQGLHCWLQNLAE